MALSETHTPTWLPRALCLLGVVSLAVTGCAGDKTGEEEEDPYPPFQRMSWPDQLQSRDTAIVMRVTNALPGQVEVNRSLVAIASEIDVLDALSRGGVPEDGVTADLAGSSVEQVKAYYDRKVVADDGVFPEAEAVDACGNPVISAFIPPSQLQHAAPGAPEEEPLWPDDCSGPDCNTLQIGTLDVYLSSTRPDGMVDMVINLLPNMTTSPPSPGLFGHLLAYFPSTNNPGFTEAPVVINARQVTVSLENLWQRQKAYVDLHGMRELYTFPSVSRTVYEDEVIVLAAGQEPDWCADRWASDYTGVEPFGCDDAYGVTLDRNPAAGTYVYSQWMKDGDDTSNLDQLGKAFEYALRAYAVCPAVDEIAYVQNGPLEMFLCPPESGTAELCVAEVDMELGVCEPLEGGYDVVVPSEETLALAPQRYPYVVTAVPVVETGTGLFGTGTTGTGTKGPKIFLGPELEVELTVEADTILFLGDPEAIVGIRDASGQPVELPPADLPCENGADRSRFDIGEAWGAGTYTMVLPWSPAASYDIALTSIPSWVF